MTAAPATLQEILAAVPPPSSRYLARLIMVMLGVLLIWSFFAKFDEVAIAVGEVVPQGQIKAIQHLEGGIIEKIYVNEGDVVKQGDPLVQLDLVSTATSREELAVRLDGLILTAARLTAEASGTEPAFPADVAQARPALVEAEKQIFRARKQELASVVAGLEDQAHQRELEVAQLRQKQESWNTVLDLASQHYEMSNKLLQKGLTPKVEHLKLQLDIERLKGDLADVTGAIPRVEAAVAEARERVRQEDLRFRRRAREELGPVEQEMAQTREALTRAADRVNRMEIRSPIDGIVKSQRHHTIGGIVSPGEVMMEIVPTEENLVIEAKLSPTDIGYVRLGQPAIAKISTYDFVRYGGLDGQVIYVSPDSHTDASGHTYFRVVVRTDKNHLGDAVGSLPITAGMEATVDIHIGRKPVLQYLLKPVLKLRDEAFRER